MKAFVSAVFAVALFGVASWVIFSRNFQETSENTFMTSAVRLPEQH